MVVRFQLKTTVSIWIISFCAGITLFMTLRLTRTLILATEVENNIDDIASVYSIIDENSLASPFHDVRLVKNVGEAGVRSACIDEHNYIQIIHCI